MIKKLFPVKYIFETYYILIAKVYREKKTSKQKKQNKKNKEYYMLRILEKPFRKNLLEVSVS